MSSGIWRIQLPLTLIHPLFPELTNEFAQALGMISLDSETVDIAYINHLKRVLTSTGLDKYALSQI